MITGTVLFSTDVFNRSFCNINFAPDYRFYPFFCGKVVELFNPEHISMIGDCDSFHPQRFNPIHQQRDIGSSIEYRVLSMNV